LSSTEHYQNYKFSPLLLTIVAVTCSAKSRFDFIDTNKSSRQATHSASRRFEKNEPYIPLGTSLLIPPIHLDSQDKKIHVVVIEAHPDDADSSAGETNLQNRETISPLPISLTKGDAEHQLSGEKDS